MCRKSSTVCITALHVHLLYCHMINRALYVRAHVTFPHNYSSTIPDSFTYLLFQVLCLHGLQPRLCTANLNTLVTLQNAQKSTFGGTHDLCGFRLLSVNPQLGSTQTVMECQVFMEQPDQTYINFMVAFCYPFDKGTEHVGKKLN